MHHQFSLSVVSDSVRPHGLQLFRLPCPSPIPSLLKHMSIESVMPFNQLILCHPLLLPSIFPRIKVFSKESAFHIRWAKYWSFSFSISLSSEYLGLTSLVAQTVKHLYMMWEIWVRSLGQEDPLEKEMATHSSTLAWKIPWTEEP